MPVWTCIVLILVFLVIPFGMGNLLIRSKSIQLIMFGGLFSSFCWFEILAIFFHVSLGSLRLMTVLWCATCLILSMGGWWKFYRGQRPCIESSAVWTRTEKVLLAVVVLLVLLQTLNTVCNTYYGNWDDETYVGTAATSWFTDTVDRYGPHSGTLEPAFYNIKYNIASWPVYSSMLAVMTGVHPTILFRTVLPLFEIPLAYYIAYLLIKCFWKNARGKALLTLIYFQLFAWLVAEHMPQTCSEWWMIVNSWTGKALTASVMSPLILWLLIQLEQAGHNEKKRKEVWKTLLPVCWAGCFISASLHFVIPMELAVWGLFYLIRTKRWRESAFFIVSGFPTAFCAMITFF